MDSKLAATTTAALEKLEVVHGVAQSSIYLMGASFVLGSMFTLMLLLVLDFMRRNKSQ